MVNLITDRQFFAGLHNPTDGKLPVVDRSMPRYHGYCPEVLANKVARILPDVFAKPRFASNPVVDLIGIRSYAGAPLIHEGTVIGTLCALGPITRPKTVGQAWLSLMRARRDELMDLIYRRNGRAQQ